MIIVMVVQKINKMITYTLAKELKDNGFPQTTYHLILTCSAIIGWFAMILLIFKLCALFVNKK